jgi:acetate kinase
MTDPPEPSVLTINGGSSSIKFAVYRLGPTLERGLQGSIDRIGLPGTQLSISDSVQGKGEARSVNAADHASAIEVLLDCVAERTVIESIQAVGHRIVHGLQLAEPRRVTPEILEDLRRINPIDPDHLPAEIALIEAVGRRYPRLLQVVCFDTAFHRTMPRVARILPIPRRFDALGIQRYGFHGLSYEYLLAELTRLAGERVARGRVVFCHFGNGASLAAVRDGQSIDTSMGFTPAGGLPMGTRSGDLDPGAAWFAMQCEQLSPEQFNDLVNHHSGLLGVSETSSDMRDLLEREGTDVRAAEAIAMFCYHAKKWIGAFAAALGGLDTLVFAGGIGENSPAVRERVCAGLEFLGVELENQRNTSNAAVISSAASRACVRIIQTDEQKMIAKAVYQVLGRSIEGIAP